jgi:hypothetical protein
MLNYRLAMTTSIDIRAFELMPLIEHKTYIHLQGL